MIKKIPIKGISRDPSGEISSDGFCAESLNVQLDMGEVAPAIKPRPVKDAGGNELSVDGDILYIHKGIGYENLIYRQGGSLLYVATIGDESAGLVYDGLADAEITDITAIGNTVIVSTPEDMYYILWRDGSYRFLGNQIPIPKISFRTSMENRRDEIPERELPTPQTIPSIFDEQGNFSPMDEGVQEEIAIVARSLSSGKDVENVPVSQEILGTRAQRYVLSDSTQKEWLDSILGIVDEKMGNLASDGKIVYPIFVRYAVRLYDGTCYAQSIPVLLGADIREFVKIRTFVWRRSDGTASIPDKEERTGSVFDALMGLYVDVANPYSIVADFSGNADAFNGWEDIVTGVDIFTSAPIGPVQRNAVRLDAIPGYFARFTDGEDENESFIGIFNGYIDPYYTKDRQEELVLFYQTTYLAKKYSLDEFKELDGEVAMDDVNLSADYILAQEALKEASQSMHHTIGERTFTYNKRLLLAGAKQSLYNGYPFLHSVKWDDMEQNPIRFVYYIRGENGEAKVICCDVDGNKQITPRSAAVLENLPILYHEAPVAWLAYPDSRCYRIDVYFLLPGDQVRYKSYPTKAMDQADVAYAFVGFGVDITATESAALPDTENGTLEMPNSLVVSKANNPFVFPATDVVTFTAGEILNLAVANVPLSEGQAGQFPLYVFTDEGVFAMTVDSEGGLRTSHNVSRDVLLSRDALIGIEQGVFFASARGVLLLQGSRLTKVSSQMDGKSEVMDAPLMAKAEDILGYFVDSPIPLRPFLNGCFFAYDYANTRIIICNPHFNAMYVYKFDTQSWHRLQSGFGSPVRSLNSFPEAQIVVNDVNGQALLDFSVLPENEDAVPMKGLVYSRDLDLDGADIYKTISRLEVRGRFKHGHVKWQLQGSNDGLNYTVIHSLRGPSWKWFRIVLVTMLDKDERISYVELDYSPKFTDKIR